MRLARPALALALAAGLHQPLQAEEVPFSTTPSLWQERMVTNFNLTVATVPADFRGIVRYPVDHTENFLAWTLAIGTMVVFDTPLTEFYQQNIEPIFADFALPEAPISWPEYGIVSEDVWLIAGMAGTYIYGVAAQDDRAQRAGLLSAKAIVYSYLTSQLVLKTVFARKRPYPDLQDPQGDPDLYTTDPYDFFNWEGSFLSPGRSGRSMPSYHFTEYMSVARVFSGVYDDALWPYGVAFVLAVSNIEGHHHWVSDMVAGGAIGYGTARLVLKTVFARKRPYPDLQNPQGNPDDLYTTNPFDFFNWDGSFLSPGRSGRAMPSYHFTEYMSVARVFSGVYDDAIWPYGVAFVLAVSNIEGHRHWVSDMVAGGAIGYGIGSLVLKNDEARRAGQFRIETMPIIGPDVIGATMSMQF